MVRGRSKLQTLAGQNWQNMPAPRSFGSFRKFSHRREIVLPESGTMKTVLCSMKGGLFAAARPVWLYNSNLQAASLRHSTSHSSGSSSAGFCTISKTFYLLPCCIVWLAWHLHNIEKLNIHFELCLIKESHSLQCTEESLDRYILAENQKRKCWAMATFKHLPCNPGWHLE